MLSINIAEDFTETPGGRYKEEGPFSAEEFRDDILLPKLMEAITNKDTLVINFDGVYGCANSWLEEVFGGIIRKSLIVNIPEFIQLKTSEDVNDIFTAFEFMLDAVILVSNSPLNSRVFNEIMIAETGNPIFDKIFSINNGTPSLTIYHINKLKQLVEINSHYIRMKDQLFKKKNVEIEFTIPKIKFLTLGVKNN